MSKDKDTTVVAAAGEEAPPPGKKKKIIMLAIVVLLLSGAGYGAYAMFFAGESVEPPPEPGVVVTMDAITVNLAAGHYLKLKLALQAIAAGGEGAAEPDGSKALDLAIVHYTDRSVAELSSTAGRAKLKAELLVEIKEAYEGEIMDIYFTEFVMQ